MTTAAPAQPVDRKNLPDPLVEGFGPISEEQDEARPFVTEDIYLAPGDGLALDDEEESIKQTGGGAHASALLATDQLGLLSKPLQKTGNVLPENTKLFIEGPAQVPLQILATYLNDMDRLMGSVIITGKTFSTQFKQSNSPPKPEEISGSGSIVRTEILLTNAQTNTSYYLEASYPPATEAPVTTRIVCMELDANRVVTAVEYVERKNDPENITKELIISGRATFKGVAGDQKSEKQKKEITRELSARVVIAQAEVTDTTFDFHNAREDVKPEQQASLAVLTAWQHWSDKVFKRAKFTKLAEDRGEVFVDMSGQVYHVTLDETQNVPDSDGSNKETYLLENEFKKFKLTITTTEYSTSSTVKLRSVVCVQLEKTTDSEMEGTRLTYQFDKDKNETTIGTGTSEEGETKQVTFSDHDQEIKLVLEDNEQPVDLPENLKHGLGVLEYFAGHRVKFTHEGYELEKGIGETISTPDINGVGFQIYHEATDHQVVTQMSGSKTMEDIFVLHDGVLKKDGSFDRLPSQMYRLVVTRNYGNQKDETKIVGMSAKCVELDPNTKLEKATLTQTIYPSNNIHILSYNLTGTSQQNIGVRVQNQDQFQVQDIQETTGTVSWVISEVPANHGSFTTWYIDGLQSKGGEGQVFSYVPPANFYGNEERKRFATIQGWMDSQTELGPYLKDYAFAPQLVQAKSITQTKSRTEKKQKEPSRLIEGYVGLGLGLGRTTSHNLNSPMRASTGSFHLGVFHDWSDILGPVGFRVGAQIDAGVVQESYPDEQDISFANWYAEQHLAPSVIAGFKSWNLGAGGIIGMAEYVLPSGSALAGSWHVPLEDPEFTPHGFFGAQIFVEPPVLKGRARFALLWQHTPSKDMVGSLRDYDVQGIESGLKNNDAKLEASILF